MRKTGEYRLWLTVLITFFTDLIAAKSVGQVRILRQQICDPYIDEICLLVGLDHTKLIAGFDEIVEMKKAGKRVSRWYLPR